MAERETIKIGEATIEINLYMPDKVVRWPSTLR